MKKLNGKIAVITGAGSGIGRALAQQLDAAGARLALCDVDSAGLDNTVAGLRQAPLIARVDVANREAVYAFRDSVVNTFGAVDIVINNAGVALSQTVEHTSYDDFEWLMNINFWGVVYGSKAFLPVLKQRPEAVLVNVSSVFGLIAVPTQSAYNAAKFAVRGFTEALRHELEAEGSAVKVVCVHPGGIKTNIARNARAYVGPDGEASAEDIAERFERVAFTTPEKAAQTIVRGIRRQRPRVLIGGDAWLIDRIQRWLPVRYWRLFSAIAP